MEDKKGERDYNIARLVVFSMWPVRLSRSFPIHQCVFSFVFSLRALFFFLVRSTGPREPNSGLQDTHHLLQDLMSGKNETKRRQQLLPLLDEHHSITTDSSSSFIDPVWDTLRAALYNWNIIDKKDFQNNAGGQSITQHPKGSSFHFEWAAPSWTSSGFLGAVNLLPILNERGEEK